jgi:hypothetical protein
MWKLLSVVVLSSSIAIAMTVTAAAAPSRAGHVLASSEHHRCVERGFRVGTPQFRNCVSQHVSVQHKRAPSGQPLPMVASTAIPQTPPADRASDDPNRLTTSELEQTVAGPPLTQEIVVQAPRTQPSRQYQAEQRALFQKEAEARRQALAEQSMELIRTATGP